MEKITAGHPLSQSEDIVKQNIDTLKALFPTIVKEGKIDISELKVLLGEDVEENEEYYRFTWAGKSQARQESNKPSTGTLRPNKADSKDWDTTQNIFIEGDNLEVLKLLQKSYAGQIKMIYIDPPYNTGNDFVYKDDYADNLNNYLSVTGQKDEVGNKITTNAESDGRYHSNWLNMMYPRLKLARNLLMDSGLLLISIDENEVTNLKKLSDEIFGEENFIEQLVWKKRYGIGGGTKGFAKLHEYILVYSKTLISNLEAPLSQEQIDSYRNKDEKFDTRGGYITQPLSTSSKGERENLMYPIQHNGKEVLPKPGSRWIWSKQKFDEAYANNEIVINQNESGFSVRFKQYLKDERGKIRNGKPLSIKQDVFNQEGTSEVAALFEKKGIFDFPKPVALLSYLYSFIVNDDEAKNGIYLDFFAGSGSSGEALYKLNSKDGGKRKYICVQMPELIDNNLIAYKSGYKSIADITKERLHRAGEKIKNENQNNLFSNQGPDLDIGFKAFKLDTSNINAWDGNIENFEQNIFTSVHNIKEGRTEDDVLYEILIKSGLDLTQQISEKEIAGKKVYSIGLGALMICLADNITVDVAEGIGQWKTELAPSTCSVIFKDSGFTDVEKTNSIQILKRFGITEVNSI